MRRSPNRLLKAVPVAVVAVVLGGCNLDVGQPENNPSNPATETFAAALNIDIASMQKTTAGTYYKDVKVGTGATLGISATGFVVVSYVGLLKNGAAFAQALNQLMGLNSLPPGMLDGIGGAPAMREGGERVIVVPSALGYGNVAVPGVPPNSTLVFDVILNQAQ
jgi:FKBP-type peptidyl-prolyl cis-trans isomerase